MKIDNDKIIFVDDEGNRTELKIYFTWKNEKRNKTYVFFYDELMPTELIAGIIEDDGAISDVEDDDEFDELDKVLEEYENEQSEEKK